MFSEILNTETLSIGSEITRRLFNIVSQSFKRTHSNLLRLPVSNSLASSSLCPPNTHLFLLQVSDPVALRLRQQHRLPLPAEMVQEFCLGFRRRVVRRIGRQLITVGITAAEKNHRKVNSSDLRIVKRF